MNSEEILSNPEGPETADLLTSDLAFKRNAMEIVRGASWYGVGILASFVLEYGIQGLAASRLGPSDFGIFSVGYQVFSFAVIVALLALPNGMSHFIPRAQAEDGEASTRRVISIGFWLSLFSSLLVGVILYLVAGLISEVFFKEPLLAPVIKLLAMAIPANTLLQVTVGMLRGLKMSQQASLLLSTYERSVRLGFIVLFLLLGLGLKGAVAAQLPSSLFVLLIALYYIRRKTRKIFFAPPSKENIFILFHYSWPVFLSQVLAASRSSIQPVMLLYFLDSATVGIFTVARFIPQGFSMVLAAFNFLYLPVISGSGREKNLPQIRRIYRLTATWSFLVVFPPALFIFMMPQAFLGFFGPHYQAGALALRLMVVGALVNVSCGMTGSTLLATDRTKFYLLIDIFGTVVMATLGFILVPRFGLLGAASAQMLTAIAWNGLSLFVIYRLWGIMPFDNQYVRIAITAGLCLLPIYPLLQLSIGYSRWVAIPALILYSLLTVFVVIRFRLLDIDSQVIFSELIHIPEKMLQALRGRLQEKFSSSR